MTTRAAKRGQRRSNFSYSAFGVEFVRCESVFERLVSFIPEGMTAGSRSVGSRYGGRRPPVRRAKAPHPGGCASNVRK
jgi:hypothetical protein